MIRRRRIPDAATVDGAKSSRDVARARVGTRARRWFSQGERIGARG